MKWTHVLSDLTEPCIYRDLFSHFRLLQWGSSLHWLDWEAQGSARTSISNLEVSHKVWVLGHPWPEMHLEVLSRTHINSKLVPRTIPTLTLTQTYQQTYPGSKHLQTSGISQHHVTGWWSLVVDSKSCYLLALNLQTRSLSGHGFSPLVKLIRRFTTASLFAPTFVCFRQQGSIQKCPALSLASLGGGSRSCPYSYANSWPNPHRSSTQWWCKWGLWGPKPVGGEHESEEQKSHELHCVYTGKRRCSRTVSFPQ